MPEVRARPSGKELTSGAEPADLTPPGRSPVHAAPSLTAPEPLPTGTEPSISVERMCHPVCSTPETILDTDARTSPGQRLGTPTYQENHDRWHHQEEQASGDRCIWRPDRAGTYCHEGSITVVDKRVQASGGQVRAHDQRQGEARVVTEIDVTCSRS
jgi:hypothetical protein